MRIRWMIGRKDGWMDVRMYVWMRNRFNLAVLMLEFNVPILVACVSL